MPWFAPEMRIPHSGQRYDATQPLEQRAHVRGHGRLELYALATRRMIELQDRRVQRLSFHAGRLFRYGMTQRTAVSIHAVHLCGFGTPAPHGCPAVLLRNPAFLRPFADEPPSRSDHWG